MVTVTDLLGLVDAIYIFHEPTYVFFLNHNGTDLCTSFNIADT